MGRVAAWTRTASAAATALLLLALLVAAPAQARSVGGSKTLVLLDDLSTKDAYATFLKGLSERGLDVTVLAATDSKAELFRYGTERQFDNLVLFSPKSEHYSSSVNNAAFVNFINDGGNILVAGAPTFSDTLRDLALEFSADFDESPSAVFDHFNTHTPSSASDPAPVITASNFVAPVVAAADQPVLFQGIAHRVTGRNPLMQTVLVGSPTTYGFDTESNGVLELRVEGNPIAGTATVLVSALQARNNARVVFAGSLAMFSDKLINTKIDGKPSGNLKFVTELAKWVFQEKNVLKVQRFVHHRANETQQHGIYRIKDEMVAEIEISEYHSDRWHPFSATDIQVEAVMLDPYIRTNLTRLPTSSSPKTALYAASFKLPDRHGVYTFKVDYKRHGYTWLLAKEVVEVRPFRHTDFPRFLSVAWPYYVNAFAMMVGWVVVCALWLYYRDPAKAKKE